jgi:pimeloyl-ACP methyl ester carboxylesterase
MPGPRPEPRLAKELVDVERVDVATPHGTVAAWRVGEGPAVLLVHGWRDSARLWDPVMAALKATGRAFVVVDLPAHGFSGGTRCMVAEVADTVLAVAQQLGPIDAAVAHSFSANATALAVAEGMPARRLVFIAPPGTYQQPREAAVAGSNPAYQRWRRIADRLGYETSIGEAAHDRYVASLGAFRAAWTFAEGLATLDSDVLLMASVDDEQFNLASARALAEHLPRGSFVELVGLDHRASARDHMAVAAILDFLER